MKEWLKRLRKAMEDRERREYEKLDRETRSN